MRNTLPEAQVHPAIRETIATYGQERIAQVQALTAAHRVVIVGMAQNVFPKRARKFLDEKGIPYEYLGMGSYLSEWRPRLELKLWTGWATFPMIFLDGVLIGGFTDLVKLSESGELTRVLGSPRVG
jgi:monothiol glutaredoxin